jgi:hypothetical protein
MSPRAKPSVAATRVPKLKESRKDEKMRSEQGGRGVDVMIKFSAIFEIGVFSMQKTMLKSNFCIL